jgi:hypothetical protein
MMILRSTSEEFLEDKLRGLLEIISTPKHKEQ